MKHDADMKGRIYIVATNDKDLKRRIRKIPGVPIMTCATGKYVFIRALAPLHPKSPFLNFTSC